MVTYEVAGASVPHYKTQDATIVTGSVSQPARACGDCGTSFACLRRLVPLANVLHIIEQGMIASL